MSGPANGSATKDALDLPAFSLDVEALNLGADVKAVSLEILETESREPVRGKQATDFWSAVFPLLSADEPFVLDFFSHLDRVRDFCTAKEISFCEAGPRCIVVSQPAQEQLRQLFERFEAETFGFRAGDRVNSDDSELTNELSRRGLDAYQAAYRRYSFCAVCEFEDGWVTLLSDAIWSSEVIRRVRPAAQSFDVHISRPQ
ncbi:MAG TPA: hypothetical protein VM781_00550 [Candidatus Bathyarchaeia archaeon]|nr:hypothetical protein [Candidatus Bathyarchaeia archaeon]